MLEIHGKMLTGKEVAAVQHLETYSGSNKSFRWGDVEWPEPPADLGTFCDKLVELQVIKLHYSRMGPPILGKPNSQFEPRWNGYCSIGDNFPAVLKRIRNPEVDQLAALKRWFWSKKWSIPICLLVWGVPLIAGWVIAIKQLLEWLGLNN